MLSVGAGLGVPGCCSLSGSGGEDGGGAGAGAAGVRLTRLARGILSRVSVID